MGSLNLLPLVFLAGCAGEPLTEYEIQDRYNQTFFEYQICLQAAEDQHHVWYSETYHEKNKEPSYLDMKWEMALNNCKISYR